MHKRHKYRVGVCFHFWNYLMQNVSVHLTQCHLKLWSGSSFLLVIPKDKPSCFYLTRSAPIVQDLLHSAIWTAMRLEASRTASFVWAKCPTEFKCKDFRMCFSFKEFSIFSYELCVTLFLSGPFFALFHALHIAKTSLQSTYQSFSTEVDNACNNVSLYDHFFPEDC